MIGFVLNSGADPRFLVAGGQLTDVRVLQNRSRARIGSYHIGGSGLIADEPLIRCLGETIERYSQMIAEVGGHHPAIFERYDRFAAKHDTAITPATSQFFSDDQYSRPGFPFERLLESSVLSWIRARSLTTGATRWAPSQFLLVGYAIKRHLGEKWHLSGVTTGTAAHTKQVTALRSALLELIQIDSIMGHWYGSGECIKIGNDSRVSAIVSIVTRTFAGSAAEPTFYWIRNLDLPGFTVTCRITAKVGYPSVAIGIGIDLRLCEAMYKALLEAVGVFQLARISLVNRSNDEEAQPIDPNAIYNLDDNVLWYGHRANGDAIRERFDRRSEMAASKLPPDSTLDEERELSHLIDSFSNSGKELLVLDLTTPDIAELGFVSWRVWSPDTLSLSLPSAPPKHHRRLDAYGGLCNENPHPYP